MIHLTLQQLSAYLDDELVESSAEIVRRHLTKCEECTVKFATLEDQEETLAEALTHDPGDDVLERIAAAVGSAIGVANESVPTKAASVERRAGPRGERRAEPRVERRAAEPTRDLVAPPVPAASLTEPAAATPRDAARGSRSAWAAAAVLLVLGASVCVVGVRSGRFSLALQRESEAPAPPAESPASAAAPSPAETPAPAPVPSLVARTPAPAPEAAPTPAPEVASVPAPAETAPAPAAKTARAEPAPPPAPAPVPKTHERPPAPKRTAAAPARSAPRVERLSGDDVETGHFLGGPAKNLVPVIRTTTTVETLLVEMPEEAPATNPTAGILKTKSGTPPKDEFASLPPSILAQVRTAERSLAGAANDPTMASYDGAAAEWEHALSLLRGTPQEVAARRRLAEARYGAWKLSPDAYHAASATAALRSYMMLAATGPERDEAKERLAEVHR